MTLINIYEHQELGPIFRISGLNSPMLHSLNMKNSVSNFWKENAGLCIPVVIFSLKSHLSVSEDAKMMHAPSKCDSPSAAEIRYFFYLS